MCRVSRVFSVFVVCLGGVVLRLLPCVCDVVVVALVACLSVFLGGRIAIVAMCL